MKNSTRTLRPEQNIALCEIQAVLDFVLSRKLVPFQVCLLCSFCSSDRELALGFLHTPPHDGRTCPQLTVPTAKPVVDFHHQVTTHSGQTKETAEISYLSAV